MYSARMANKVSPFARKRSIAADTSCSAATTSFTSTTGDDDAGDNAGDSKANDRCVGGDAGDVGVGFVLRALSSNNGEEGGDAGFVLRELSSADDVDTGAGFVLRALSSTDDVDTCACFVVRELSSTDDEETSLSSTDDVDTCAGFVVRALSSSVRGDGFGLVSTARCEMSKRTTGTSARCLRAAVAFVCAERRVDATSTSRAVDATTLRATGRV